MVCMKCQKHLSECECPDLEERLDKAVSGGHFVYKYCKKCDKHYERCKCKEPDWGIKDGETEREIKKGFIKYDDKHRILN